MRVGRVVMGGRVEKRGSSLDVDILIRTFSTGLATFTVVGQ